MLKYSKQLQKKIKSYYTVYYRDLCGLPDYKERVENRLKEEDKEMKRIDRLQNILNMKFEDGQKHFIFGAGTGGLAVVLFSEYGCDVYGIEPDDEEFEIIQEKCAVTGIDPSKFKKECGEELSFKDDQFDIVHCFTVIEHVEDVEKCIQEMIRITKLNGYIYIHTPNYRYPYEGHYKILFPTFLPKPLKYLYLMMIGRPWRFLKTINFVTERGINKILNRQKGIEWMRVYKPLEKKTNILSFFLNFIKFNLFIYPDQEIIVRVH